MNTGRGIFYGWWVLVGVFVIMMVGPLSRYSMSAFFPFISADMGWSRQAIGLAQSITLWTYSLFVLLCGWMIDRLGSRKTYLIGGLFTLAGWIALSTVGSLGQLYLYYGVLMGLAVSMTHAVPAQATLRKWFRRKAGLVVGISSAAFAVGISIFMPLLTNMADSLGWRSTSLICGPSFGIVIILIAFFVIRDTPESMGLQPDGESFASGCEKDSAVVEISWTVKEAVKTSQLWLLFLTYSMLALPLIGVQGHLVMWGVDLGSSRAAAGIFMTAMTVPSIVSKIGGGWLGDRYGKRLIILVGQILGIFVMLWGWQAVDTQQSLTIFAILMGISYGLPVSLFSPYLGDLFGRAHVGSLFGIVTLGFGLVGGCGALIWGKLFDMSGSYNLACLISSICYVIAAVAIFLVRPITPKATLS